MICGARSPLWRRARWVGSTSPSSAPKRFRCRAPWRAVFVCCCTWRAIASAPRFNTSTWARRRVCVPTSPRSGRDRSRVLARVSKEIALEAILAIVQLAIAPAEREQLVMAAALDHLAMLEDEDLVRALDGRQTVCDHERGPA